MQWTDPDWLAEAHAWIAAHVSPTGEIEQPHVRPWSTVMRVPTADGAVWFKANSPQQRFEAALVGVLASERPDVVPPLVAVDLDRGWMLMADAGERLREIAARERSYARWLEILPLMAGVQIDLARRADELVALGVPDLRLAVLPATFEAFLDEVGPSIEDDELVARAREMVPWVREASAELASHGIPETIQHDDFHDGQVFVKDDRYLLMDWGDACVSHPFFTLSVTLQGFLSWGLDDVENSEPIEPYAERYVAEFDGTHGVDLGSAMRLGWACRVVNGHLPYEPGSTAARLQMFVA
jgi:aminoglycoside/choline kinase family phosphotransferase